MQATFQPRYAFDLAAEGAPVNGTLEALSKGRRLPGRAETGLFPAQKHVAVALWKRLQTANHAICVGEMGVGKSTLSVAVSELMRGGGGDTRPTIVLCPPHVRHVGVI